MRWILDACTFIYLIKANLFSKFMDLVNYPVVIGSSVYQVVVLDGKAMNVPDATEAEISLNKFKIPIISIDVSQEVNHFIDKSEASCYILAKEDGICLTSDDRAYKKFIKGNLNAMRLDSFYFENLNQNRLTEIEFVAILKKLESVNATKPKSILFFMEKLQKRNEVEKNE